MSRRLPLVGFLHEQIRTARALSPEQPGVIRLSCFDAEALLGAVEAADDYLRRENYSLGEDTDTALERLEERVSLLYEPKKAEGNIECWNCGAVVAWEGEEPTDCLKCGEAL